MASRIRVFCGSSWRRRSGLLDPQLLRAALDLLHRRPGAGLFSCSPALLSDALTRRSTVRQCPERDSLAVRDLSEARRRLLRIEDCALSLACAPRWTRPRCPVPSAQPERAVDALQRAADYFARAGPVRVPSLRLQTARVQSARGLVDSAEEDLLAGIHLVEAQRVSLHDLALQASFFEQAVPLYDDMVALQLDQRHDPVAALSFVERGRGRQLADSLAAAATWERSGKPGVSKATFEPGSLQRDLPQGVALVYYVSLDRRLLAGSSLATTFALSSSRSPGRDRPTRRRAAGRARAPRHAGDRAVCRSAPPRRPGAPADPLPGLGARAGVRSRRVAQLRVLRGPLGPVGGPLSRGGLRAGRVPERQGADPALGRFETSAESPCPGRR